MYLYMYTIYVFIIHTVQITVKVYVYRWICMYIMLCILHIYSLTWIVITDKYVYIQLSLMAQWWRICLPLQEMRVWSLGRCGKIPWRRAWQPTPVFLPGESHGQRSLAGYTPWVHKESDTTEATEHKHIHLSIYIHIFMSVIVYMFIHRHTDTHTHSFSSRLIYTSVLIMVFILCFLVKLFYTLFKIRFYLFNF